MYNEAKASPAIHGRRMALLAGLLFAAFAAQAADLKRNLAVAKPADTAHAKEQRVALVIGNGATAGSA